MPEETKSATSSASRQSGKSIEERVAFAVAHRTRVYVLTLLNEGVYSPEELARIIGEPVGNIAHHIKQLLEASSIELAKTERRRNTLQHFYRAVEMPYYSDEEIAAMTPEERQETIGLTLQCVIAEIMTAFWSGKMEADPRLWLSWRWFNVDGQGRQDLADEQERSWNGLRKSRPNQPTAARSPERPRAPSSWLPLALNGSATRRRPRPSATSANAD